VFVASTTPTAAAKLIFPAAMAAEAAKVVELIEAVSEAVTLIAPPVPVVVTLSARARYASTSF